MTTHRDHGGQFYQDCLVILHESARPTTYVEIGTLHGDTLALAQCASIAIDPTFQLRGQVIGRKPTLFLFQMTSDEFFNHHSPTEIFGRPADLAFLDGKHLFEHLLRDFANTERFCQPSSMIVLHDCIPPDLHMTVRDAGNTVERSRSRHPDWWTGDVWKLLPILWQFRPDLVINAFDAPPTGLIVISNLDPHSHVLDDHYAQIVSSFTDLPDEEIVFNDCMTRLELRDTRDLVKIVVGPRRDVWSPVQALDTTGATTIASERLATLLDDPTTSMSRSSGLGETRLVAAADVYHRAPPVFIDTDQASASTRQKLATYTRALQQECGPIYCAALHDAIVVGQGSVITRGGILLWESAAEFLAEDRVPDGLRPRDDGKWQLRRQPVQRVVEPCLLLKRPWFRNFGHWLIDCAALLALVQDDAIRHGWTIVTGIYDDPALGQIVEDTLALLAPAAPVLCQPDDEPWQFDDLHYVMPVHVPPLIKLPAAIQRLRALVTESRDLAGRSASSEPRRIYLSREDTEYRHVVNDTELRLALSRRGFETVFLTGRSLFEQARLFRAAEAIIGVKGAAMANIVFCEKPCSVMVLSPADFPDPFVWDIAGQLDLRYAELFCSATTSLPQGRNDLVVDLVALGRMLDAVLETDRP